MPPNQDGTGRLGRGKKCNETAKADRMRGAPQNGQRQGRGRGFGRRRE